MLTAYQPDSCCGKALAKTLEMGLLDDVDTWTHEKCGCEWRASMVGSVKYWEPHGIMEVW